MYCDGCPRAFHFWCLDPPMEAVDIPEGDMRWFCPSCTTRKVRIITRSQLIAANKQHGLCRTRLLNRPHHLYRPLFTMCKQTFRQNFNSQMILELSSKMVGTFAVGMPFVNEIIDSFSGTKRCIPGRR